MGASPEHKDLDHGKSGKLGGNRLSSKFPVSPWSNGGSSTLVPMTDHGGKRANFAHRTSLGKIFPATSIYPNRGASVSL